MDNKINAPVFNASKSIYLEFYRGVAALGVAWAHYLAAIGTTIGEFYAVVFVEMFFPLSGFILAPQVIRVYKNNNALWVFYIRRWIRTIPLYLLGLFAMALITYNFGSPEFYKYLFFYNFLSDTYVNNNFYPISWSLAAEEYYYILFPLFMIFFPSKSLLGKAVSFFIVGLLIKVTLAFFYDSSFIRIGTLTRFDSIGIGFVLFLIKDRISLKHTFFAIVLGVVATMLHFAYHNTISVILFMYTLNFAFGMICALIYVSERKFPCINIPFRWVSELIGSTSYAVYVVHLPVLAIAIKSNISMSAYILIVVMLSVAIHNFFERPLLALRPKYKQS